MSLMIRQNYTLTSAEESALMSALRSGTSTEDAKNAVRKLLATIASKQEDLKLSCHDVFDSLAEGATGFSVANILYGQLALVSRLGDVTLLGVVSVGIAQTLLLIKRGASAVLGGISSALGGASAAVAPTAGFASGLVSGAKKAWAVLFGNTGVSDGEVVHDANDVMSPDALGLMLASGLPPAGLFLVNAIGSALEGGIGSEGSASVFRPQRGAVQTQQQTPVQQQELPRPAASTPRSSSGSVWGGIASSVAGKLIDKFLTDEDAVPDHAKKALAVLADYTGDTVPDAYLPSSVHDGNEFGAATLESSVHDGHPHQ